MSKLCKMKSALELNMMRTAQFAKNKKKQKKVSKVKQFNRRKRVKNLIIFLEILR